MAFGGLGLPEVQAFRPSHGDIARGISARCYQSLRPQSCKSLSLDFCGVSRSRVAQRPVECHLRVPKAPCAYSQVSPGTPSHEAALRRDPEA